MKFLNTENKNEGRLDVRGEPSVDSRIQALQKEIDEIQPKVQRYREQAREAEIEINKLAGSKREAERIHAKEIEDTLIGNPDATARGMIDRIYKLSSQKLGQIDESLSKMHNLRGAAILQERRVSARIAELKSQIKLIQKNAQVLRLFKYLRSWIHKYNESQKAFDGLKRRALEVGDYGSYKQNIDTLKLPGILHVVADSGLRNPQGLSQDRLAIFLAELCKGDAYESPQWLHVDVDYTRDSDKPLIRDGFSTEESLNAPKPGPQVNDEDSILELI